MKLLTEWHMELSFHDVVFSIKRLILKNYMSGKETSLLHLFPIFFPFIKVSKIQKQ